MTTTAPQSLTRAAIVRVKAPLRDLWWNVQGRRLRNPPLPERIGSLLFVCLGNICRSPFAGMLAQMRVTESKLSGIVCASAGIRTSQAGRSPQEACEASRRYGLSLEGHTPQTLTRELMDAHDVIVVMEGAQFVLLREAFPDRHDRIFLLSLFDPGARGYLRYNIADPYGSLIKEYEACYQRIDRAVAALLDAISSRLSRVARGADTNGGVG